MPEREKHPEDRVRVRNIVQPGDDDVQAFWLTRYRKVDKVDANGNVTKRDEPYEVEVEWNFKDGFFFLWGGKSFALRPGEEKTYPRWLADHAVGHMVQYELNRRHAATKRMLEDGTPRNDNNILNNQQLRKQLTQQAVLGVEEWYDGPQDDFDTILNKKLGGDFDGIARRTVDREVTDVGELSEVDQGLPSLPDAPKAVPPTDDADLAKAREEADAYGIAYGEKDSAKAITAKVLKAMA